MSDERISQLEKQMAVVEATVPPLIQKMDASTTAMNNLTGEISSLVNSNLYIQKSLDDLKVTGKENSKKIGVLENKGAVRDSKAQVFQWVERTFWVGVCGAGMKALGII